MGRTLDTRGLAEALRRSLDHPRWDAAAERCLACGNCTLACPTCFCNTVEDTTDLTGAFAERTRRWDSCFTLDLSYIHGGPVRPSMKRALPPVGDPQARHLAVEQFGTAGCVGCGRCITWCPAAIDLTEEAAIAAEAARRPGAAPAFGAAPATAPPTAPRRRRPAMLHAPLNALGPAAAIPSPDLAPCARWYRVPAVHATTTTPSRSSCAPPAGHAAAPFRPGQFNMLYVFGVGEVPISISGDPDRPETLVHTTREVGAVTRAMRALRRRRRHRRARALRQQLAGGRRRGPRRRADRRRHRPAAAAPGALPRARPARALRPRGAALRRPHPRGPAVPRRARREWRSQLDLEVHVTVDRATGNWRGNVGVVTPLVKRAPIDPRRTVAMICGPEVMIRAACRSSRAAASARRTPSSRSSAT
jgi:ferredoxin